MASDLKKLFLWRLDGLYHNIYYTQCKLRQYASQIIKTFVYKIQTLLSKLGEDGLGGIEDIELESIPLSLWQFDHLKF